MNEHKIYCIIITYNAMKWIDKCFGSLRASRLELKTVVIDNGSKDETVAYIKRNYPEVHLIVNDVNQGFGQANNQGFEFAYNLGATHFFLLNQDAWIREDTIGMLVEVQDKYGISLVSPIHLNGKGDLFDYNYFETIVIDEHNRKYVSDLMLDKIKPYYTVFKINAAAWMLSRKTVEQIGGFDPLYFHYGEDGNYCQRIKFHKGEVAFVPESYIYHDRERQGNMQVFKKNSTIMMLLLHYSDINNSFWKINKGRILMHLSHFKLAFTFLFKLKIKDFAMLCDSYISFFIKLPQLKRSMKLNKKTGPNWLNFE